MSKPLFSVLIANYNNASYLKDCLDSVLAQTYPNWEIIFVDDASTDISLERLQPYLDLDKRIKLFKNESNRGCGYTKRRCAELAKGEIAGFLDPDDALTERALEFSVKEHLEYPDVSLVYSQCYQTNEKLEIEKLWNSGGEIPPGKTQMTWPNARIGHFATFKKKLYDQTEGISPKFERAVDQDLYLKMEEVGDLRYVPEPLYLYRIHQKGISSMNDNRLKAYYWYLVSQRDAWRRRQGKAANVENISKRELDRRFLDYYLTEAYAHMKSRNWKKMYRFLIQGFRYIRVDKKLSLLRLGFQPIKNFLN